MGRFNIMIWKKNRCWNFFNHFIHAYKGLPVILPTHMPESIHRLDAPFSLVLGKEWSQSRWTPNQVIQLILCQHCHFDALRQGDETCVYSTISMLNTGLNWRPVSSLVDGIDQLRRILQGKWFLRLSSSQRKVWIECVGLFLIEPIGCS